jgi:hypothetical protein
MAAGPWPFDARVMDRLATQERPGFSPASQSASKLMRQLVEGDAEGAGHCRDIGSPR